MVHHLLMMRGGKLEVLEGHPEGANMPFFPDAPQEYASGLDTELEIITAGAKNNNIRYYC
jgi:hypothetical protein